MRYIVSIIWAVLISGAISYVLTSMGGEPFVLTDTLVLAGIISVAVFLLGDAALTDKS